MAKKGHLSKETNIKGLERRKTAEREEENIWSYWPVETGTENKGKDKKREGSSADWIEGR